MRREAGGSRALDAVGVGRARTELSTRRDQVRHERQAETPRHGDTETRRQADALQRRQLIAKEIQKTTGELRLSVNVVFV